MSTSLHLLGIPRYRAGATRSKRNARNPRSRRAPVARSAVAGTILGRLSLTLYLVLLIILLRAVQLSCSWAASRSSIYPPHIVRCRPRRATARRRDCHADEADLVSRGRMAHWAEHPWRRRAPPHDPPMRPRQPLPMPLPSPPQTAPLARPRWPRPHGCAATILSGGDAPRVRSLHRRRGPRWGGALSASTLGVRVAPEASASRPRRPLPASGSAPGVRSRRPL